MAVHCKVLCEKILQVYRSVCPKPRDMSRHKHIMLLKHSSSSTRYKILCISNRSSFHKTDRQIRPLHTYAQRTMKTCHVWITTALSTRPSRARDWSRRVRTLFSSRRTLQHKANSAMRKPHGSGFISFRFVSRFHSGLYNLPIYSARLHD